MSKSLGRAGCLLVVTLPAARPHLGNLGDVVHTLGIDADRLQVEDLPGRQLEAHAEDPTDIERKVEQAVRAEVAEVREPRRRDPDELVDRRRERETLDGVGHRRRHRP